MNTDSTTVSKAIEVLHLLQEHPRGLTVTKLAEELGTQRAPLYRILRSFERTQLVHRGTDKRYRLGFGLVPLAKSASGALEELATPVLQKLADVTNCTAMIVTEVGDDLLTAACVTPSVPGMHLSTPVGYVHPRNRNASRVVIDSRLPATDDDPEDVKQARADGWFVSGGAEEGRRFGVSALVDGIGLGDTACITIVTMAQVEPQSLIAPVIAAAAELAGRGKG